jgi:polyisoprenoid-binding protein YceI
LPATLTGESKPSGIVTVEIQDGTVARYLVREQLARLDFPNDAVGETSDVAGLIKFNPDGEINSDASKITVDLRTLKSDENKRDRFLRSRSLESDVFPTAEFVVKELPGLEWPLPNDGEASFQIVGDMTVHGLTRPIIWEATAQFSEDSFSGIAKTSFTFDEFDIDVPRVRLVLSVEETMRFELDFLASITSE